MSNSHSDTPSDPLSPMLIRRPLFTAKPVTDLPRHLPGIWIGNGLEAAGIEPMSESDPEDLERLVGEQGAYDVVLLEAEGLPPKLASWGAARTGPQWQRPYLESMAVYVAHVIPPAMQQIWNEDG